MTLIQTQATMERAERLWLNREYSVPSNAILTVTHNHRITAYDGEFLILAKELGVPLVTFDKAVKETFPDMAMNPEAFLKC